MVGSDGRVLSPIPDDFQDRLSTVSTGVQADAAADPFDDDDQLNFLAIEVDGDHDGTVDGSPPDYDELSRSGRPGRRRMSDAASEVSALSLATDNAPSMDSFVIQAPPQIYTGDSWSLFYSIAIGHKLNAKNPNLVNIQVCFGWDWLLCGWGRRGRGGRAP